MSPRKFRRWLLLASLLAGMGLASLGHGQTYPGLQGTACNAGTMLLPSLASYASANSTNTSQALPTVPTLAVLAVVTVTATTQGGSLMYRDDGGTPTAAAGLPASPSTTNLSGGVTTLAICQPSLALFRYVSGPNGGARLDVLYYQR